MVKLQHGKMYVTRDNRIIRVNNEQAEEEDYTFYSPDSGDWYTENGNYWSDGHICKLDIIAEYFPPEPPTEWKFPVGSTIKNRYQASGLYVRAHVKVLDEADSRSESLEYYCYDIASKTHSLYSKDVMERNYSLVED